MNRGAGPFEIADLVARAERVKRNREIILRTVKPPAEGRPARRSAASPAPRVPQPDLCLVAAAHRGDDLEPLA
jgi:hypothetical protein